MSGTRIDPNAKLEWDDAYSVGIEEIDEQHRGLTGTINQIDELAVSDNMSKEKVFLVLNTAVRYAEEHFGTEESYFEKYGYPEYSEHKKEHDRFVEDIFSMVKELDAGRLSLKAISTYLKNWFSDHLVETDQKYKSFLLEKLATDRARSNLR